MIKEITQFPIWLYTIRSIHGGDLPAIELFRFIEERPIHEAYAFDMRIRIFLGKTWKPKITHPDPEISFYNKYAVHKDYSLLLKMTKPIKRKLFDNIFTT